MQINNSMQTQCEKILNKKKIYTQKYSKKGTHAKTADNTNSIFNYSIVF